MQTSEIGYHNLLHIKYLYIYFLLYFFKNQFIFCLFYHLCLNRDLPQFPTRVFISSQRKCPFFRRCEYSYYKRRSQINNFTHQSVQRTRIRCSGDSHTLGFLIYSSTITKVMTQPFHYDAKGSSSIRIKHLLSSKTEISRKIKRPYSGN